MWIFGKNQACKYLTLGLNQIENKIIQEYLISYLS